MASKKILPGPENVNLPDIVDVFFAGIGEVETPRPVAGGKTWRASLLGSCMRRQYLELKEGHEGKIIDAKTQRIFWVGHITGLLIGLALDTLGVLQHGRPGDPELSLNDDEWDIGCHVDFVVGGPILQGAPEPHPMLVYFMPSEKQAIRLTYHVRERLRQTYGPELPVIGVELKSKRSDAFWGRSARAGRGQTKYGKRGTTGVVAGENQLIQAAVYDLIGGKRGLQVDHWDVLSLSKDDLSMHADPVGQTHRDEALRRLELLNAAQGYQDVPCSCLSDFGGKGWKYCPFGVDDFTCCDPAQLPRRLEVA